MGVFGNGRIRADENGEAEIIVELCEVCEKETCVCGEGRDSFQKSQDKMDYWGEG